MEWVKPPNIIIVYAADAKLMSFSPRAALSYTNEKTLSLYRLNVYQPIYTRWHQESNPRLDRNNVGHEFLTMSTFLPLLSSQCVVEVMRKKTS
ncbi:hypothetical protein TNCV_2794201 [Trichonephila clavipes]|nr:hypothetical protein TNCV_2794201 [Trichonephila clavipes]